MMLEIQWLDRQVVDYSVDDLPFGSDHADVNQIDPSKIRVFFPNVKRLVDVGCLAYKTRTRQAVGLGSGLISSFMVQCASLCSIRAKAVSRLLEDLYVDRKINGLSDKTLFERLKLSHFFFDWCDNAGFNSLLDSLGDARAALKAYCSHLEHRVKANDLKLNSAGVYLRGAIKTVSAMTGVHESELTSGMRLIRSKTTSVESTEVPAEEDVAKNINLCRHVFDGFVDLVLNNRPYPYRLKLPDSSAWVFPLTKWMATPEALSTRDTWEKALWAYNFAEGRIESQQDIRNYFNRYADAGRAISSAKRLLNEANVDNRHMHRLRLATWACNAFLVMFLANTGMNFAQAQRIEWSDEFEIGSEYQGFRVIKPRAGGQNVEFHISIRFLPVFKRFLDLRSFLLNGNQYDRLFFSLGINSIIDPSPITHTCLHEFFNNIRRMIDPSIKTITAREWRVNKSDYLIRTTDVSTAAMLLQNTESTLLNSYASGSETVASKEMTRFFNFVKKKVFVEIIPGSDAAISAGHCNKYGDPIPDDENSPITPNCKQPEGCLYCEHYAIHADEIDIRKLCSMSYVINETSSLSESPEHFTSIFGKVLEDIALILKDIASKSDKLRQLVESVQDDVESNENLDRFWQAKLDMLVQIGAL